MLVSKQETLKIVSSNKYFLSTSMFFFKYNFY